MNLTATIKRLLKRKIATAALVAASLAAFAITGDDGRKNGHAMPSNRFSPNSFSLRTPYSYRANNLFAQPKNNRFIMLNTVVTYQKGNATYVMPLKKKVLLDKVKFNPAQ